MSEDQQDKIYRIWLKYDKKRYPINCFILQAYNLANNGL